VPSRHDSPHPAVSLYHTDLAQTSLPEILVTIHRYKAPGVVECRRGEIVKRIFLDRGQIIFATTNQISESLGDKLLAAGRITEEQYVDSVSRVLETGKRHGVTLVEMGILSHEELFASVREQIEAILWTIFGWDSGAVTFVPGRDKHLEFVKVEIPVPRAVLNGVRMMTDARALVARLGVKTTLFERTENPIDLDLEPEEQALLEVVDGRSVLYELVNTPPLAPSDNARILYGFLALQLIAPKATRQIKVQIKTGDGGAPTPA
jgi:two-component system, OmpR family, response regulator